MASEWIPVYTRLPTEEDIKRNGGDDFVVTAIYGVNGIMHKTVFMCNFNLSKKTWESCDFEIVAGWRYKPTPAIFNQEKLDEMEL